MKDDLDLVKKSLKEKSDRMEEFSNEIANKVKEQVDEAVRVQAYNSIAPDADQVAEQMRQAAEGSSPPSREGES